MDIKQTLSTPFEKKVSLRIEKETKYGKWAPDNAIIQKMCIFASNLE